MSLSDRRRFLVSEVALTALSACGFEPLYSKGSAARRLTGRVAVDEIDGLMGFELRKRLNERLGSANAPLFDLTVAVEVTEEGLAISQENEITRYNLTGTAAFQLRDRASGQIAHDGTVRAFAAHSATASPFATRVAERDARARLATALADQIASRLAVAASGLI